MLYTIAHIQIVIFCFFFLMERLFPHLNHPVPRLFTFWWCCIGLFALMWLRMVFFVWTDSPGGYLTIGGPVIVEGCITYLFYSFGNYWFHRWKHSNPWLWRVIHCLHHSTSHMEAKLSFYRHPLEIMINTIYILLLGKVIFNISVEAIAIALMIEGALECFHHSNIKTPSRIKKLGYVIQLPEMHLVHHQYGLHKYNYSPFIWDTIFGTAYIPETWNKKLGFKNSFSVTHFLFLKNRT